MDKAEVKRIGDYLKELEEGLYERNHRGLPTLGYPDYVRSIARQSF